jgi:4-hydroxy-tetrahydrodipicolinate synthase
MPSPYRPSGLLAPLVTPFAADGSVDIDALERLGADFLDAGATGLITLSTTGEPTALSAGERDAVVAATARVCADRGADLVVGAGTNDTHETIRRHEALAGVPGVSASLAVVPYYVRPSEAGIVAHFQAVAERSPVPLITYNVPYRTGRALSAAGLLEVAAIDNVAGVKQAVGALDGDTLALLAAKPEGFAVLGGDDAYVFPTMLMGGEGAIAAAAHLCTERFVAMIAAGAAGDVAAGRPHAEALLPLISALFAEPNPAVIKALLHAEGRLPTPDVRLPLLNASPSAVLRARQALDAARQVTAGSGRRSAPSR